MLTNALIRFTRKKALPAPFELVVPSRRLWVLELPVPKKTEPKQIRWLSRELAKKKALLARWAKGGTLHLTFSSRKPSPRLLDPAFLKIVASLNIALEIYEAESD